MSVERQSGRDLELVWVETTGAAAPAAPERFRPDDESTWPAEGEPCVARGRCETPHAGLAAARRA